jgi:hypothetical protein
MMVRVFYINHGPAPQELPEIVTLVDPSRMSTDLHFNGLKPAARGTPSRLH